MRFQCPRRIIATFGLCLLATAIYYKMPAGTGGFQTFQYIMKKDITLTRKGPTQYYEDSLSTIEPPLTVDSPVYALRWEQANQTCLQSFCGKAGRVISDKEHRIAYCIVPKVGCTFWINIIRFLKNETDGIIFKSPMDIPRVITHYGKASPDDVIRPKQELSNDLGHMFRFMFVRDPYARLWSAWIDKFLLTDFWYTQGLDIANFFNFTPAEKACPKDISFEQFLTYITNDNFMVHPELLNEHWAPYKYVCDPCLFRPHLIGKMETFVTDSRVILEATNLTWVPGLSQTRSRDQHSVPLAKERSLSEMRILIDYNHVTWQMDRVHFNGCFSALDLYHRLWRAFQYNGHLPPDVNIPEHFLQRQNYTPGAFFDVCSDAHREWGRVSKTRKVHQKKYFFVKGYKTVSTDILKKVQKLFELDFEMYGYNKKPPELFDH